MANRILTRDEYSDEVMERTCRAIAARDGHNPDLRVVLGAPMSIAGQSATPLCFGEPSPVWTLYRDRVEGVLEALKAGF